MTPQRNVYVIGGACTPFLGKFHPDFVWKGHPDFGLRENPTIEEHLHAATRGALEATGVPAEAIDRGVVGNFTGECFVNQGHLGAMLAGADPGLNGTPAARVEGACASGGLAVAWGVDSIQAGRDLVLVAGVEVQTTVSAKVGADFLARAAHYATQRGIDPFTFPALFARRTKAYFEAHGIGHEDLAHVVVKAYGNANRNDKAHMRERQVSFEWAAEPSDQNPLFLSNAELQPYLKLSDCSQVSDGASALILASEAGLERLGRAAADEVRLLSYGHATGALGDPDDLTRLDITELAAAEAYADAGASAAGIGVAEVHDCFSVTELLMTEALGFAGHGEGARLAADGATALDGRIPVNTGGGLLAFGHPVGATGVKQVLEVQRQMKGLCGDYQIETPPTLGLTANMGGDDRTAVVTILGS
jgi:acetyl-CoA acyltransferase